MSEPVAAPESDAKQEMRLELRSLLAILAACTVGATVWLVTMEFLFGPADSDLLLGADWDPTSIVSWLGFLLRLAFGSLVFAVLSWPFAFLAVFTAMHVHGGARQRAPLLTAAIGMLVPWVIYGVAVVQPFGLAIQYVLMAIGVGFLIHRRIPRAESGQKEHFELRNLFGLLGACSVGGTILFVTILFWTQAFEGEDSWLGPDWDPTSVLSWLQVLLGLVISGVVFAILAWPFAFLAVFTALHAYGNARQRAPLLTLAVGVLVPWSFLGGAAVQPVGLLIQYVLLAVGVGFMIHRPVVPRPAPAA